MKKIVNKWWFWTIIIAIILLLYFLGTMTVKSKVENEVSTYDTKQITNENRILVVDQNNKISYLDEYSEINSLNTKVLNELEKSIGSYDFNNKSVEKTDDEIIIRNISEKENISYTIKYSIRTNEIKEISIKNFDEWTSLSTFNIIVMDISELSIFNFEKEQLSKIWNHVKNNEQMDINTGEWRIQNFPELKTFYIEKNK